ncbi:SDR family oxidoreductase [Pseudarthrobacter sp. P1]|uniref:SDR family oxidoreductase n=1 Tax=Pseudarthrobacter sp. P1 TaxID=3418418 RepID=UPI003CF6D01D
MVYIIHGATGAQGSPVLTALLASGRNAVAAVRDSTSVPAGIDAVAVELTDAPSLAAAYAGADGVFVHLPMGSPSDGSAQAAAIAAAVAEARPGRVVISTSGQIVDDHGSPLQAADDSPIMSLIRDVTATGIPTAIVAPRLYLENLQLPVVADSIQEEGVLRYPLPTDYPVSWSSHQDVADVVVQLLTGPLVTGTIALGHLPGLTGQDLATAFATYLGRQVHFEAITPEVLGDLIAPIFGPASLPVVGLYRALNAQEANVIDDLNSAQKVLGISPRPVLEWLAEATA